MHHQRVDQPEWFPLKSKPSFHLKGVSNSSSQNIAFLSTEVKGSTLKQSTVELTHIPKGYTQDTSSKVQTAPKCASHSDEIICSFFAQQASMPTTYDDEDLLQIDPNSTAKPKLTQTVPLKSTANVFYQGTARPKVHHAILSQSTGRPYYPRMDNTRPRTSSLSRTPHRPQRPKKIMKSIWVKKGSTIGSQAVLPQTVKKSAMINLKQIWRPKENYLDYVNRDNGSYTLKQFEYGNPEEDLKDYAIIDSGCSGSMIGDKDKLSDFKEFKGGYVA
ncbi:hypothetical protein Tco_0081782, partial [Tanacetum coccineum]